MIAYRQVAAHWRRQGRAHAPLAFSPAGASLPSDAIEQALLALPPQLQQVLILRYAVGLSVADIAQVLGRSLQVTEALLNLGRQQFEAAYRRTT